MKIHTEIYGVGRPVVLIHGWAMHTGIWRSFAKQLSQYYQVICVDLPGHGRSEKVSAFTLEAISKQLQKILPSVPCTLVGWSLGGSVALDLANRFPNKINNVVIISSNPCFVKTATWAGMKMETLQRFAADLSNDCYATLLRFLSLQVHGLEDGKALLKELKTALHDCEPPPQEVLKGGLTILEQQDLRSQLARLHCPAQVILGTHDTLVPVAVGEQILALNPRLTLNIINRAAHVPFLSHPTQLISMLRDFLEKTDAVG
jgi:pimeloyl-[acyl-carrier protein] methyl ester esterase